MLIFTRLKKVQGKKKRDAAAADAKRALDNALMEGDYGETAGAATATANLLEEKDEDIIF